MGVGGGVRDGGGTACKAGGTGSMCSEGGQPRRQFRADCISCPLCASHTLVSWSRGMYAISLQGSNREYLRRGRVGAATCSAEHARVHALNGSAAGQLRRRRTACRLQARWDAR